MNVFQQKVNSCTLKIALSSSLSWRAIQTHRANRLFVQCSSRPILPSQPDVKTFLKQPAFTFLSYRSKSEMESFITDKAYINGKWESVADSFEVLNPYNGEVVGRAADCDKALAEATVKHAHVAFQSWKNTCAKARSSILKKWFELILKNQKSLAELITKENGKPIKESIGEVAYAASFVEWLAEEAKRNYGTTIPTPHPNKRLMSIKQPIGVAGMITPWNFPAGMITRKACAAIAAGCTVVLKPAEDTPFSALAIAKLGEEAGLPAGVLNIIPSSREHAPEIGNVICTHPDVAAVSFTGSTATGKILLGLAASTVKKVSMELGGLAPFIVFDSADMNKVIPNAIACKFRYMGQTCVCANRIFVQESVHDEFVSKLVAAMKKELILGDTLDPANSFGPLINEKALEKVESQVEDAIKNGATVVCGGKRGSLGGTFYEPTLITGVTPAMKCCNEETFGPIAAIIKFKTEDEVIALANDSRVGLAGYFFSNDVAQCWRVAEKLEVGMVGINEGLMSTAEAPFGGVKESGLGREGSQFALDEFTEMKYMCWGV
uniref:succinate-semialdehyde dehydrogenase, mitochondrial n=1 Tax=Ciona intestinalis TaxID=7719 RepID=UPI00006A4920|nr:succinate-semialdehyde dehydrogenase, mitochondrial [Ciona intestinalis]|eukprot:XP_002128699.1 succinate-semialdehyde dehydrogenase, mitochondrial [Ciona intestinalis]